MLKNTLAPPLLDSHPFVVERYMVEDTPNRPVPMARLLVTPMLRTSGLLETLSEEAARTLLAVLCHLTPNGWIRPATSQVAEALGISVERARERIDRLAGFSFQGEPVVHISLHENGLETVHPARTLVGERDTPSAPLPAEVTLPSFREAVLRESRARYGTPREEVERMVLAQLGHYPEELEDSPRGEVWRKLIAVGVPKDQVALLIENNPLDVIREQIEWLPLRDARNPARFIAAAIQGRYAPPSRVRLEQAIDALPPPEDAAIPPGPIESPGEVSESGQEPERWHLDSPDEAVPAIDQEPWEPDPPEETQIPHQDAG